MGSRVLTGLFCFATLSLGAISTHASQAPARWQGDAVATLAPATDVGDASNAIADIDLTIGQATLTGTDPVETDPVESDAVIADDIRADSSQSFQTETDPIEQDQVGIDHVDQDRVRQDPIQTDE